MCGCGGNVTREVTTSQQLAAQLAAAEAIQVDAVQEQVSRDNSLVAALANANGTSSR
jgi:hypothetical protein